MFRILSNVFAFCVLGSVLVESETVWGSGDDADNIFKTERRDDHVGDNDNSSKDLGVYHYKHDPETSPLSNEKGQFVDFVHPPRGSSSWYVVNGLSGVTNGHQTTVKIKSPEDAEKIEKQCKALKEELTKARGDILPDDNSSTGDNKED